MENRKRNERRMLIGVHYRQRSDFVARNKGDFKRRQQNDEQGEKKLLEFTSTHSILKDDGPIEENLNGKIHSKLKRRRITMHQDSLQEGTNRFRYFRNDVLFWVYLLALINYLFRFASYFLFPPRLHQLK